MITTNHIDNCILYIFMTGLKLYSRYWMHLGSHDAKEEGDYIFENMLRDWKSDLPYICDELLKYITEMQEKGESLPTCNQSQDYWME